MERHAKTVFHDHAFFIKSNIVPSEALWSAVEKHNILPDTMLADVKACPDAQSQINKLLALLSVRGPAAIVKLVDILQHTNHNFLAQFLRERMESEPEDASRIDAEAETQLLRRLPRLEKQLSAQDRQQLAKIVQEQAWEMALRNGWADDRAADKERAIAAKAKQLEENWRMSDVLQEKDKMITQLAETLEAAVKDAEEKGVSLHHVSSHMAELKRKHDKDLSALRNYNAANDSSLRRQDKRIEELEASLQELDSSIVQCLRANPTGGNNPTEPGSRASSSDSMTKLRMLSVAESTRVHLSRLLERYQALCEVEKEHARLRDDAFYVMTHTGRDVRTNLREAFQGYVVDNEEALTRLRDQIHALSESLARHREAQGTQQDDNMVRDLEHILQNVRAESKAKDDKIKCLREEIAHLESELEKLRMSLKENQPPVHSFNENRPRSQARSGSSIGKTSFMKSPIPHIHGGHTHHHDSIVEPARNRLPAIKPTASKQGTIHYHSSQHNVVASIMSPATSQRAPVFRAPAPRFSGDAMIINQVGVPKKSQSSPRRSLYR